MATALIINAVLMAGIVLVIVGLLAWAVATQHRDHGVLAAGPLFGRRIWSRPRRAHAGSVRPLYARGSTRVSPGWSR